VRNTASPVIRIRRASLLGLLFLILTSSGLVLLFRFVNPPCTPLMLYSFCAGNGLRYSWQPLRNISPRLQQAVLVAEDQRFYDHAGFDFNQIEDAVENYSKTGRLRGASTITMQTARSLFLWQGRSWPRKALEFYFTVLIELMWSKARTMEVYLNIIEWGKGVFGAEAAARLYFNCSAASLERPQAALMAAVLPNPRRWSPVRPSRYIRQRARYIMQHMDNFRPLAPPRPFFR
jgi:monofunctional biosynthetic peptidoglycan transglycosylase